MLELIPRGLNIDFVGKAKFCITLSLLIILLGIGSIIVHGGLNEGIDFSGGTLLQLRFSQPADLHKVREGMGLAAAVSPILNAEDNGVILVLASRHRTGEQQEKTSEQHVANHGCNLPTGDKAPNKPRRIGRGWAKWSRNHAIR